MCLFMQYVAMATNYKVKFYSVANESAKLKLLVHSRANQHIHTMVCMCVWREAHVLIGPLSSGILTTNTAFERSLKQ